MSDQIGLLIETHTDGSQGIVYVKEFEFEDKLNLVLDKGEYHPDSIILSVRQCKDLLLIMKKFVERNDG